MKIEEIVDKNNRQYIVQIDEDSFDNNLEKASCKNWKVPFKIFDQGSMIGQGHFRIECKSDCKYPETSILNELITRGTRSLKEAINDDRDISSMGFNFRLE